MGKVIKIGTCVVLFLGIIFGIFSWQNNKETYTIDGQKIYSIKHVVGKRSLNGISVSYSGGESTKEYQYSGIKQTRVDDLSTYVSYLTETEHFKANTSYTFEDLYGDLRLTRENIDIYISWSENTYTLILTSEK